VSGGLVRLGFRVQGDQADEALAALIELLPDGVEERRVGAEVEYATYGPADALPTPEAVRERLGDALTGITWADVPENWERRWHEFLGPIQVREGDRELTIRPPWLPGGPDDLVVDPDVLFGAGTHPTTRLVLRLLLAEAPGGPLCDWGAGTGVLAVAAARLGFAPVTAVELDAGAAGVIAANARTNGVEVDARVGDAGEAPWAPIVCANLFAPLLTRLAAEIDRPPERLLLSGVLVGEADAVAATWAARGLTEARRLEEEGWAASLLVAA
jgi:ribosomal protein L11 methyltransferase